MIFIEYDNGKNIIDKLVINSSNFVVNKNSISWDTGSLTEIKNNFILLNDNVKFDNITDEVIALDRKGEFVKVDELEQLRRDNEMMKSVLDYIILNY